MNGQTALQTSPVALFSCRSGFFEAVNDDVAAELNSTADCSSDDISCVAGANQFQLSIIDLWRVLVTISKLQLQQSHRDIRAQFICSLTRPVTAPGYTPMMR